MQHATLRHDHHPTQRDPALHDREGPELQANAGDPVRLMELSGGWWWAENIIGEKGWLPEHALSIDPGIK